MLLTTIMDRKLLQLLNRLSKTSRQIVQFMNQLENAGTLVTVKNNVRDFHKQGPRTLLQNCQISFDRGLQRSTCKTPPNIVGLIACNHTRRVTSDICNGAMKGNINNLYEIPCAKFATSTSSADMKPPVAPKKPEVKNLHGNKLVDEYAWMKQGPPQEMYKYIEAENRYAHDYFKDLAKNQERWKRKISLLHEVSECEDVDDITIIGKYVFYSSISQRGSSIFCTRNIKTGKDEVLLDAADFESMYDSEGVVFTSFKISPCQRYLGAVVEGSPDVYDAHIISMEDEGRTNVAECIPDVVNIEFSAHNTVFYTKPYNLQARHVWKHHIGSPLGEDELVYEEEDERFFVDLSHTKDRRYIIINSNSRTTSELWMIDSQNCQQAPPTLLWPRQDGIECYMDHMGGKFFALTTQGKPAELKLLTAKDEDIFEKQQHVWEELYTPPLGHVIQDMDVFATHCVLCLMVNNVPQIHILNHSLKEKSISIKLPPVYTTLQPSLNADPNAATFQFHLSSPTLPSRLFELDLKRQRVSFHDNPEEELGASNRDNQTSGGKRGSDDYVCQRLMAKCEDGSWVPVTVFHKADIHLDGSRPMLVTGYGAYGRNLDMDYKPERMALLADGWVLAYCHVRGGGELGRRWYHDGRLDQKQHSFQDFESCIELLHSLGYSKPSLTAGWGASAGGLLLGVLCNTRPELLRAAVMRMPFVDILSSMLDPTSALTSQDFEEWGDPLTNASIFDLIYSYSPYQNIKSQTYPSILVTASLNDQRVPVWGPAKYVARLRDTASYSKSGTHSTFLLNVLAEGGHFGPDEHDGGINEASLEWTFLQSELGLLM